MSVGYQDNFKIGAPKPADNRYGYDDPNTGVYRLYTDDDEAKEKISVNFRYQGLTVGVDNSGKTEEWWWRDGILDGNLIKKTLGGNIVGAKNGLEIDTTDNYVILGGSLTKATTITTNSTNTLSLAGLETSTSNTSVLTVDTNGTISKSTYLGITGVQNGIEVLDSKIQLGATLTKESTKITYAGDAYKEFIISIEKPNNYFSQFFIDRSSPSIATGDLPNEETNYVGSASALSLFRTVGSVWTKNYSLTGGYKAEERWLTAHPWISQPLDDNHKFQVYDNVVSTNRYTAILGHYYDERVKSTYWRDTWTSTSSIGWPGWVVNKVYKLKQLNPGDSFLGIIAVTLQGVANTDGWVFKYTSGAPTTWTNLSIVEGDFPDIDASPRYSGVLCKEGETGSGYENKGVVYIEGNGLLTDTVIDQSSSTKRGFVPGRFTNATRPKTSTTSLKAGELFYNESSNKLEFFISTSGVNDTWGIVTNTTTTYPA